MKERLERLRNTDPILIDKVFEALKEEIKKSLLTNEEIAKIAPKRAFTLNGYIATAQAQVNNTLKALEGKGWHCS